MSGEIKAGRGTLIGNAGEYYCVAELLKRGVVAALTPRNTPAFDVLATKDGRTAVIRVKTKSERYDVWQWVVKKDGTIFRELRLAGDFTILVNLTLDHCNLAFYVIPTKTVNGWLVADFERWLQTPGKGGRPHNPQNTKRNLLYSKHAKRLDRYRENWDILWE